MTEQRRSAKSPKVPTITQRERQELRDVIAAAESNDVIEVLGNDRNILSILFPHEWLANVSFDEQSWHGVDFTGADLEGSTFCDARIKGARFDFALVERKQLLAAKDWAAHVVEELDRDPLVPDFVPHPEPGRRMSERVYAPELVMLPPLLDTSASTRSDQVEAWRDGRLAVAATCVRQDEWEWTQYNRTRQIPSPKTRYNPWCVGSLRQAQDYVKWLTLCTGGQYEIIDLALYDKLTTREAGQTIKVTEKRNKPAAYDDLRSDNNPRASETGLIDLVGNLRQIAKQSDTTWRLVGGSYKFAEARCTPHSRWTLHGKDRGNDWGLRVVRIFPPQGQGSD